MAFKSSSFGKSRGKRFIIMMFAFIPLLGLMPSSTASAIPCSADYLWNGGDIRPFSPHMNPITTSATDSTVHYLSFNDAEAGAKRYHIKDFHVYDGWDILIWDDRGHFQRFNASGWRNVPSNMNTCGAKIWIKGVRNGTEMS